MAKQAMHVSALGALVLGLLPGCGDDIDFIRIHDIQGSGHTSPLDGHAAVTTRGVVTGVLSASSFFLQTPDRDADGDPSTSEGIFVTGLGDIEGDDDLGLVEGDLVDVTGVISEGLGSSSSTLPFRTQYSRARAVIITRGVPLPTPVVIGPNDVPTAYSNTTGEIGTASFDPRNNAIDFYETLEGMLVRIENPLAVAPPVFGKIPTVADMGSGAMAQGLLSSRGALVIDKDDLHPERLLLDDGFVSDEPRVNTGHRFNGPVEGILTTDAFDYIVVVKSWPETTDPGLERETTTLQGDSSHLTVATYNVENLTATDSASRFTNHAVVIASHLKFPDIIAVEEIGDNDGTKFGDSTAADQTFQKLIDAIAAQPDGITYEFTQIDPGPPEDGQSVDGGLPSASIRVGFLYNPARVTFTPAGTPDATTAVTVSNNGGVPTLSLNPGRVDPTNEAFVESRKPLAAMFTFNGQRVYAIANHFTSKSGDASLFAREQPPKLVSEEQRVQQAAIVEDFVGQIQAIESNARVIVLGDLNDFQFSPPVTRLAVNNRVTNLIDTLPANERYSFLFLGNAQVLDHILATSSLTGGNAAEVDIVHVNSEFATGRASDHDPVVARFAIP